MARQKAEIEKKKDRERKKHVRPWDKAKLTADQKVARSESSSESEEEKEWKPQREYQPMSQGETGEVLISKLLNYLFPMFRRVE